MQVQKLARLPDVDWASAGLKLRDANICFCRFLYVVGVQSIRIMKHLRRNLAIFFRPFTNVCEHLYFLAIGRRLVWLKEEIHSIQSGFLIAKQRLLKARSHGALAVLKECFHVTGISFRLHKSFVLSVLGVAAPLFSILLLFFTVQYWNHLSYGLILENNGKQIAFIQNENTYEQATEMVNQRMVHDTVDGESQLKFKPNFQLSIGGSVYATASYVCNKLIEQSNGIIEEASGLYVDGELMGVVKSGADLRYLIQNLLDAAKENEKNATAQFIQNVQIENGLYPTTSIISTDDMNQLVTSTSKAGVTYTVKEGDTVTSIAKANHMKISDLNKINGNQLGDSIHPGDLINIEVAEPRLKVELIKTETDQVSIPFKTVTQNDDSQYTDYTKVLTQGADGLQECVEKVYTVNGIETKRETVSNTILSQPVDKVVLTGTKKRPKTGSGVSSGSLMWPVPSLHTITTYFTWRWGQFHTGIDISGSSAYGKTIVAADGGVVIAAGWDGGYGNRVVVRHNGTLSTLYGHCSKILVSTGQKVSKGQAIAQVGSTGNSTGPHCHFEVIKNGTKVNPIGYVHN
ncbi:M23 family metallopeptidase [Caproiciproducens sp. NJN-50]|uniref:M23 family metallopeptidase n=1 Tax=Acutalibacteraceae TaxID=3082771 RepID=UPI000FFE09BA|nr:MULTISPECIES: M23 family metallopeptidase [Acutalibacteraceae]QAT49684.1 M23 family metallopeptidase [Caproiciproducens sp. NJN-50]